MRTQALRTLGCAPALIGVGLFLAPAAIGATLSFDVLQESEKVKDYYNGGTAGFGSGPGPMYGVTFPAQPPKYGYASGRHTGIDPPPSKPNYLTWPGPEGMWFNVADGFTIALSFSYLTRWDQKSAVTLYEGPDKSGRVLAQFDLRKTNNSIPGDNSSRARWAPITLEFRGVTRSAEFRGEHWILDNIVFRTRSKPEPDRGATEVPEPGTLGVLTLALLGLFGLARKHPRNGS
jgi:PEP-CTERM motif-containing protein